MIPVAGPWITQREIDAVAEATAHGWYGNAGLHVRQFETAFAEYLQVPFAIALPSGTAALHLSLLALGIGPGDEVIVPEITWIASAAPITYVGATPVFADIGPQTWCLSAEAFESCITPRTKAVIPVDLYGNLPDMDAIRAVAARRNVHVIEDAAQAIGSEYKGRKAGTFGLTGCFSFHGSKTLTTGEGGMLVTDRPDLAERIRFLADHGRVPGERLFWNSEVAHKYKMSSLQAALGLAQLGRIGELIGRKCDIFAWYRDALAGVAGIDLNVEMPGTRNTYWMTTAILAASHGMPKEELMRQLAARGIASRPFFYPLSSLPAYAGTPQAIRARDRNGVAYRLSPYGVNLPSALSLDRSTVAQVCEALRAILAR